MADLPDKPPLIDDLAQHQQYNPVRAMNAVWRYAERMDAYAQKTDRQTGRITKMTVVMTVLTVLNVAGVGVQIWLALRPCPPPAPQQAP